MRLMDVGHEHAWESILAVLSSLGYQHIREVVGRVDACVDLPGVSMQEVGEALVGDRVVCRSRKDSFHRLSGKIQTYMTGGKSQLVRIYDKMAECRNDPSKAALVSERRWGEGVTKAVRVEFQLRNKGLKRHFQVGTIEELFANLGTITKWCTHEWFRISTKKVDRKNKNQSRACTSEFWKQVQEAFRSWTSAALPRTPKPRTLVPDLEQLKQQAVGCVSSIVAHVADGRDFMACWLELGREAMVEATEVVKVKQRKLAAAARVMYPHDPSIPF